METTIIGIDCATKPEKTGLACGVWNGTTVSIQQAILGQRHHSITHTIIEWLPENGRVLLAIDAPLGWPLALGTNLAPHQAGELLAPPANSLFRRETDHFIHQHTKKLPLDVGADRIARTAHKALGILAELRQNIGHNIPLVWQPDFAASIGAIEVYPGGTLQVIFAPEKVPSYKKTKGKNGRFVICQALQNHWQLLTNKEQLLDNDDVLDAAICVLCGADFLSRKTMPPINESTAQKEGWIWVRQPGEII